MESYFINGKEFKSATTHISIKTQKEIVNIVHNNKLTTESLYLFLEAVGMFIDSCNRKESKEKESKIKERNKEMTQAFSKAIYYLKLLASDEINIEPYKPEFLSHPTEKEDIPSATGEHIVFKKPKTPLLKMNWIRCHIHNHAQDALFEIETIMDLLDEVDFKPRCGRPSIDGHIKALAMYYRKYIGEPTSYRDGPFYKIIQIILETVGLPADEPYAAIRRALSGS